MKPQLKRAEAEHADDIRALVRTAYEMYVERMDREPAPMLADYEGLIDQQIVTVALMGDAVAGVLICYPQGDQLHVENVAVSPDFQGHGIGGLLMTNAEQQAQSQNISKIGLYTNEVMTENFPFYEALGFQIRERAMQDGYARIFFEKTLNGTE